MYTLFRIKQHKHTIQNTLTPNHYEGQAKSFKPEHIRLQFFSQSIYQWNVHSCLTPMSLLRIWRHR